MLKILFYKNQAIFNETLLFELRQKVKCILESNSDVFREYRSGTLVENRLTLLTETVAHGYLSK